jgi:hypothetical protein
MAERLYHEEIRESLYFLDIFAIETDLGELAIESRIEVMFFLAIA